MNCFTASDLPIKMIGSCSRSKNGLFRAHSAEPLAKLCLGTIRLVLVENSLRAGRIDLRYGRAIKLRGSGGIAGFNSGVELLESRFKRRFYHSVFHRFLRDNPCALLG